MPVLLSVEQDGLALKVNWIPLVCDIVHSRGRAISYEVFVEDEQKTQRKYILSPYGKHIFPRGIT